MEAEDRQIAAPAEGALPPEGPGQSDPAPGPGLDPQTFVPSQPVPELIAIDQVDVEPRFQARPLGDLSLLATDLARLGQLFPIDVRVNAPNRYQVICGYRRVAALKFLHRDQVLARVHPNLTDGDALLMALASAVHMLDKALALDSGLAPEGVEEEVEADELAGDVTQRLGEINQDLALLAEVFASLDANRKEELLRQLRYSAELVAYLEGI